MPPVAKPGDRHRTRALSLAYLALETPREGQAAHTHIHEIVGGLRHRGWMVELIAATRGGSSSGSGYGVRLLDYIKVQWSLVRRLHHFDAVYMRSHFAAFPAALWARIRSRPVFQEINGLPDDIFVTYRWLRWIGPLVKWSYHRQMKWAAHVFVVTDGLADWAREKSGHDRVSVVSNGANTGLFTPSGDHARVPWPYIAFVGGLTQWHGIGTMIAATRSDHWPDEVRLVIIGDGVARDQVAEAGTSSRIVALGRTAQHEAAKYLRGALAALSITEDTNSAGNLETGVAPLKLFEAMASGVPVIVSDLPYQARLVRDHQTGLVVPMADPEALARAVAQLAVDPDMAGRLGQNGAAYVATHASWQARADAVGRIMRECLDGPA